MARRKGLLARAYDYGGDMNRVANELADMVVGNYCTKMQDNLDKVATNYLNGMKNADVAQMKANLANWYRLLPQVRVSFSRVWRSRR